PRRPLAPTRAAILYISSPLYISTPFRARLYADCRHETPTAPLYRVSAPGEPPPRRRAEASQPGPAQEAPPARLLPPALCAAPLQGALPLSPGGTGASSFIMGFPVF
ncbi:apelin receptor early endogenous ligand, partial [Columba livia]